MSPSVRRWTASGTSGFRRLRSKPCMRFQRAKKEHNETDLRHLFILAQNNFSKIDSLRSRLSEEADKLESCAKALEEVENPQQQGLNGGEDCPQRDGLLA